MGKTYISPSGTAKETQKIYVGNSNNIAQEIKRAYIGDSNGVARMVFGPPYGPTPILPDAYQQVLYIESTGTQYINLGVYHTNSTAISSKIQFPKKPSSSSYNGLYYDGDDDLFQYYGYSTSSNGELTVLMRLKTGSISKDIAFNTNINTFHYDMKNRKIGINDSYTNIGSNYTINQLSSTKCYQILCARGNAQKNSSSVTYSYKCSERIYNVKWYVNNVVNKNLYPCYRKSDNVIGLYDMINNKFFTNNGSGTFLKGEDHIEEL